MFCLTKFPKLLIVSMQANRALARTDTVRPVRAARADIIYSRMISLDPDMWTAIRRQESLAEVGVTEGEGALTLFLAIMALVALIIFSVSTFSSDAEGFSWSNLILTSCFILPFLLTQWRFYARNWVLRKMSHFPKYAPYEKAPKEILQAMKDRGLEHALCDMSIVLGEERAAEILGLLRSGDFSSPDESELIGEALEALRGNGKPKVKAIKNEKAA